MRIPTGQTEQEVVDTIDRIIRMLAPSFKFGYHTIEDMGQVAWTFAIQGMDLYDESRPLPNFIYTHVRNRLINYRRDHNYRSLSPCELCHGKIDGETGHPDKMFCKKHIRWQRRNFCKQNISNPLNLCNINDEKEANTRVRSTVVDELSLKEILSKIDRCLSADLRSTYLRMLAGLPGIPKQRRDEVVQEIRNIVGEY